MSASLRLTFLSALLVVPALHAQAVGSGASDLRGWAGRRLLRGETTARAVLGLPEGRYRLLSGGPEHLYDLRLDYRPDRYTPTSTFLPTTQEVRLGLTGAERPAFRFRPPGNLAQGGSISLSSDVEWDLDATLVSSEADFDLTGLPLTSMAIASSASRTVIRFRKPNQALCTSAQVRMTSGDALLEGMGYGGCRFLRLEGRLGRVVVDFSGDLPGDIRGEVGITGGVLVLRIPREVGVRLAAARTLATLRVEGLERTGDGEYRTPGFEQARRTIDLELREVLAVARVEWLEDQP